MIRKKSKTKGLIDIIRGIVKISMLHQYQTTLNLKNLMFGRSKRGKLLDKPSARVRL